MEYRGRNLNKGNLRATSKRQSASSPSEDSQRKKVKPSESEPQDFELIELFIEKSAEIGMSTPPRSEGELDISFKTRFQSFINQIPSYLHSVEKEGFFPHFFLGNFSTLLDTQIAKKLDIKKVYFRFDTAETLKVVVVRNDQIRSAEDAIHNISLFSISEGEHGHQFTCGELEKILQENIESEGLTEQDIKKKVEDTKNKIKDIVESRLVRISKGEEKKKGISVEMKDEKILDSDASCEFSEIAKELWGDPENDISKLSSSEQESVKQSLGDIFTVIHKIHSRYESSGSLQYGEDGRGNHLREAAHHGFVAGVFMNFRYRYNLKIYLEKLTGRGYSDIVLLVRGPNRSVDSIPIVVEMKSAAFGQLEKLKGLEKGLTEERGNEKSGIIRKIENSLANGLQQVKNYAKGLQPNSMGFITFSMNILCIVVNLDSPKVYDIYLSPPGDRKLGLPIIEELLERTLQWDGEQDTKDEVKHEILLPLERIYCTFPGVTERKNSYFSRFLLGGLLPVNKFQGYNLKKSIFLYDGYPLEEELREKSSFECPVTTLVLTQEGDSKREDSKSKVLIFHIKEGGRGKPSNKKVPISADSSEISEITEVYISLDEEGKSDFFSMDKIARYNSLSEYQEGRESFKGELIDIPYPDKLEEAFDKALDSQTEERSIDEYNELFKKTGEAIFPFKSFIGTEAHFRQVLNGAFRAYSSLKLRLRELPKTRVLVLTEFQIGRGRRVDMVIHVVEKDDDGKVRQSIITALELKGPSREKSVEALKKEVNKQMGEECKESFRYKEITEYSEARLGGVVFDNKADDKRSLIVMSKKKFISLNVPHSSIQRSGSLQIEHESSASSSSSSDQSGSREDLYDSEEDPLSNLDGTRYRRDTRMDEAKISGNKTGMRKEGK